MTAGINMLAVLVAAIASFVIGGIWYSKPVFGKAWARSIGHPMDSMSKRDANMAMLWQFIGTLVMSFVLAGFIYVMGARTVADGIQTGFMVWLGFVLTTSLSQLVFEKRSSRLFWITNGFYLLSLMVMGAILAAWV